MACMVRGGLHPPFCKPSPCAALTWVPPLALQDPLVEQVGKSVPPPDLAPEQARVFKAAERLAYVLRRWVGGRAGEWGGW